MSVRTFTRNRFAASNYNQRNIASPAAASVLLRFDGANNSTTMTDFYGKTWTANGNAKISTTQSKYGGSSLYLDGSGDYLTTTSGLSDFNFANGQDFTLECWVYPANTNSGAMMSNYVGPSSGWSFQRRNSGYVFAFGDGNDITASDSTINTWVHVAVCRSGTTLRMFINGTVASTVTGNTTNYSSTKADFLIGGLNASIGFYFNGYIDDLRISRTARYVANFTPPAAL